MVYACTGGSLYGGIGHDIETARRDFGEADPARMHDDAAQPGARPAAGIKNRNGTGSCYLRKRQLRVVLRSAY